jgi:2,4-dienoyl-CoA reductase-like NADH-dependent reductase (Old Yellow Enzyme family)
MTTVFEETTLAGMKLKNRIIRSATHEGMGDKDGRPMPELGQVYANLVKGGVGAMITGFIGVQKNGRALSNMRMLDHDELIDAYQAITALVKESGVPIIAQLAHGGGQIDKQVIGERPAAPSAKFYPLSMGMARALTEEEIAEIIDSFVAAVERAYQAGFSGVQLHAAHGYLLQEFLSPRSNTRGDRWGGSTENRFRIIAEIIRKARDRVGKFPILVKFSAYDGDKHGVRIEEGLRIAELFQKSGFDAIEVSCGGSEDGFNALRVTKIPAAVMLALVPWYRSFSRPKKIVLKALLPLMIKRPLPLLNYNVEAAARIKKAVDLPVIVLGGIRRIKDIEQIIGERKADYVAMARPFIIEPEIVNRFKSGTQEESRCINCGYCLLGVTSSKLRCYYGQLKQSA